MDEQDVLADRFEAQRTRLRSIAYRMLGSPGDADDAVQETWLRLARTDPRTVDNLAGWLTTVLGRVCLDMLRARRNRPDDPVGLDVAAPEVLGADPEREAVRADAVGRALLVVLDRLTPAERVAFVLHDMFAVPFDAIAAVVGRNTAATKKLASRARHRVRGSDVSPTPDLAQHRQVVARFLDAARGRDLAALLAVLAPDVVRRADSAVLRPGTPAELRGADAVAEETTLFAGRARTAEIALLDGVPGFVVAPAGRLALAVAITVKGDRVAAYEVIADPERLARLVITVPLPSGSAQQAEAAT